MKKKKKTNNDNNNLKVASVDASNHFCVDLEVDAGANAIDVQRDMCCIQVALLYTTYSGERAVRLHTLSLAYSADLSAVFRSAHLDAHVFWAASLTASLARSRGCKAARGDIARRISDILAAYRTYCARNPAPGQLILPEALKLLPAYVLGLLKSALLRPSAAIRVEWRAYLLSSLVPYQGLETLLHFCYPLAIALNACSERDGFPNDCGGVFHPAPLRLLRSSLGQQGAIVLLDAGLELRLYFGQGTTNSERMQELLSAPWAAENIDIRQCPWDLIPRSTPFAQRVSNIVASRRMDSERCVFKGIRISKAGDQDEAEVNTWLVEDAISSSMSLTGFLRHLHGKIQHKK